MALSKAGLVTFALFSLSGCAKLFVPEPSDVQRGSEVVLPDNVATKRQNRMIKKTIRRIERISKKLGLPQTFDLLPVFVVDEPLDRTHRWGYCQLKEERGVFIALNKWIFHQMDGSRELGFSSLLFQVLLHEIGHCYFNRLHEPSRLGAKDFLLGLFWTSSTGSAKQNVVPSLPVSNMAPAVEETLPDSLDQYYVGEILGLYRAAAIEDLEPYLRIFLIPEAP